LWKTAGTVVWTIGNCTVHTVGLRFRQSLVTDDSMSLANKYQAAGLRVYINGDGPDVYEEAFMRTATIRTGKFQPTLILVGIRLGIDRITPVYWEALKTALQMPQSIGIAG
jgi:hypothetical protein